MVEIFICEIKEKLADTIWQSYFTTFPLAEQERNRRYIRWEDQHAHLFGRLLLQRALYRYGYPAHVLGLLQFDAYQKPFIDNRINFNISHSGKYVACAVSKDIKVGFDVEQKNNRITISDFKDIFSTEEWACLNRLNDQTDLFYKLWTRKESVVKALGQGLSIPLRKVEVLREEVYIEGDIWFINDLDLDASYSFCLATNTRHVKTTIVPLDFYESANRSSGIL